MDNQLCLIWKELLFPNNHFVVSCMKFRGCNRSDLEPWGFPPPLNIRPLMIFGVVACNFRDRLNGQENSSVKRLYQPQEADKGGKVSPSISTRGTGVFHSGSSSFRTFSLLPFCWTESHTYSLGFLLGWMMFVCFVKCVQFVYLLGTCAKRKEGLVRSHSPACCLHNGNSPTASRSWLQHKDDCTPGLVPKFSFKTTTTG